MGLFGRQDAKSTSTSSVSASVEAKPKTATPEGPETVIGHDTTISGNLTSSDNMRIDGRVEGKIVAKKRLVIGQRGEVHAEVDATSVSIQGTLQGNCQAASKVEITRTGRVFGDIRCETIKMDEGAVWQGSSKMAGSKRNEAKTPVKSTAAPPAQKPAQSPPSGKER